MCGWNVSASHPSTLLEFQSDRQRDALKAEGNGGDPLHANPRTVKLSSISRLLPFSLKAAKHKKKNVLWINLIAFCRAVQYNALKEG